MGPAAAKSHWVCTSGMRNTNNNAPSSSGGTMPLSLASTRSNGKRASKPTRACSGSWGWRSSCAAGCPVAGTGRAGLLLPLGPLVALSAHRCVRQISFLYMFFLYFSSLFLYFSYTFPILFFAFLTLCLYFSFLRKQKKRKRKGKEKKKKRQEKPEKRPRKEKRRSSVSTTIY